VGWLPENEQGNQGTRGKHEGRIYVRMMTAGRMVLLPESYQQEMQCLTNFNEGHETLLN
jgi:hypothetical protein